MDMEPGPFNHQRMGRRPESGKERIPLYVGEWIAALGLKQKDVAAEAGIGEPHLTNIKTEGRQDPSYSTLFRIADAMGITVDDLRHMPPPISAPSPPHPLSPQAQAALSRRNRRQ